MPGAADCDYCHLPMPGAGRFREEAPAEPLYCCYGCNLAARITASKGEHGQVNWLVTRLGIAAFLTMAVMVCSFYSYGQQFYDAGAGDGSAMHASLASLMQYLAMVFATPVFLLLGVPILDEAFRTVRRGELATDVLVAVGVAAALAYSYVATLTGGGHTYYETACMVLVLFTLGRWIEASGKLRASNAVASLEALLPAEATILRKGRHVTMPPGHVRPGDRLIVKAGQRIAADGTIESGCADIDEQLITGESTGVTRRAGDAVRAGTLNLDGLLTIRVTATGTNSTLGRMQSLLADARRIKGRYERIADRAAAWFVPAAALLAALACIGGTIRAGFDEGIYAALAVLLISCPCALGIATPLAVWVVMQRAAGMGVLFRTSASIEILARVRAVFFDKTGTLTTGEPAVASIEVGSSDEDYTVHVLAVAAALADASDHHLSRAIAAHLRAKGVAPAKVHDVRVLPGRGIVATVNGHAAALGNMALMADRGIASDAASTQPALSPRDPEAPLACLGIDGYLKAVFTFDEQLRPAATATVMALKRAGCDVVVLTGDHHLRGRSIARTLGVEVRAELLPEDKINHLRRVSDQHMRTAMIGDGINDAPALAAADVGIAMGCGADLTRESADVCLLSNDLSLLPNIIRLTRRGVRTIKQNLFWAAVYNAIGIPLAMTGRLSPVFAAGAMVASSLIVLGNSLRLHTVRLEDEKPHKVADPVVQPVAAVPCANQ